MLLFSIVIGIDSALQSTHPNSHMLQISHLVQQPDDITCGPTSVCMFMSYYGIDVSVDEIKKITKTVWYSYGGRDIGMTVPSMISFTLNHYGFKNKIFYGNMERLKHFIASGRPCVVLVRSGEWNWHYVLVNGFNETYIFYANPSSGELEALSTIEFRDAWDWSGDLKGRNCGILQKYFLKTMEIYPNSFIALEG